MSEKQSQPAPVWVRLAIDPSLGRRRAYFVLTLNFAVLLVITGIEWGSESVLGKVAVALGLIGMVFLTVTACWMWLAFRWVDRNGQGE